MGTEWVVVDKLVHELGSLRAVVQEIEAQPDMADDEVVVELRGLLDRAADTVHLVVGGDETMVAKAWKCIADAREVGDRARRSLDRVKTTQREAQAVRELSHSLHQEVQMAREESHAQVLRGRQRVEELKRARQGASAGPGATEKRPKA